MMNVRIATYMLASFVLAVSLGCGSKLPTVEGIVTLDGDPIPEARVIFESPERPTATAKTDDQGRYEMRTASQTGMAAGSYSVAISAYQTKDGGNESPVPILITPKKYNSSKTSGLAAEIVAGPNQVDFELQSKKSR